jgi:hypothetical protein
MADLVKVTVARGCHITIAPHPSGIAGMPPAVIHGGNTAVVTADRAAKLYAARLIMHPVTGAPPPPYEAEKGGVTISFERAAPQVLNGNYNPQPSWRETAKPPTPQPQAASATRPRPVVTTFQDVFQGGPQPYGGQITDADGNPWPNF